MKSRCMSMMRSAVDDQSRSIGPGSAAILPLGSCTEFAINYAPHARELSEWIKQGPCHCVQCRGLPPRLGIPRVFSRLDFEAAIAYSLCAGFVTCICLFIERDVSCVILQLGAAFRRDPPLSSLSSHSAYMADATLPYLLL